LLSFNHKNNAEFFHLTNKETDEYYINQTIELARNGIGNVNPNPLVGSIIVKNGSIIGKGYHARYGKEHAEIVALKDAGSEAHGATLYVNLEPCCHYGKTPPCTDAIIKAGIKRVVVGMVDPNPLVNEHGIKILRQHGIEVSSKISLKECETLNKVFIKYISTGLPYVTVKVAQSIDGRIATRTGHSRWISSEPARKLAHRIRAENDVIIAGIGTVIKDDPKLDVRLIKGNNPTRIILDSELRIPLKSQVLSDGEQHQTIIATVSDDAKKIDQIRQTGADIWQVEADENKRIFIPALMKKIAKAEKSAVMVEGGSGIITSFLKHKMVDYLVVAIAPKILGSGIEAIGDLNIRKVDDSLRLINQKVSKAGPDVIFESDVVFPNESGKGN